MSTKVQVSLGIPKRINERAKSSARTTANVRTTTTFFPIISGLAATSDAAFTAAPALMPTNKPCRMKTICDQNKVSFQFRRNKNVGSNLSCRVCDLNKPPCELGRRPTALPRPMNIGPPHRKHLCLGHQVQSRLQSLESMENTTPNDGSPKQESISQTRTGYLNIHLQEYFPKRTL